MDLRLSKKLKINALKIMEQKFNLFKTEPKHTYNIKKEDYEDIHLTTSSAQNINAATGNLDFEVNSTDAYFDMTEAHILAKITVTQAADKNITLENNFFPRLFSQMVLRLNGNSFQTIDDPYFVDSILKYITLPKDFSETEGSITGWFPDTHSGNFVNKLSVSNPATNDELTAIVNRLNLEKVNTGFQYRKKYFTPKAGANDAGTIMFSLLNIH